MSEEEYEATSKQVEKYRDTKYQLDKTTRDKNQIESGGFNEVGSITFRHPDTDTKDLYIFNDGVNFATLSADVRARTLAMLSEQEEKLKSKLLSL